MLGCDALFPAFLNRGKPVLETVLITWWAASAFYASHGSLPEREHHLPYSSYFGFALINPEFAEYYPRSVGFFFRSIA